MSHPPIDPENYRTKNANIIKSWVVPRGKIIKFEAEDDFKRVRILGTIKCTPDVQQLRVRHYYEGGFKVDKNVSIAMHDRQTIYNMLQGENPTWSNKKLRDATLDWMNAHVARELKKLHRQAKGEVEDLGLPSSVTI